MNGNLDERAVVHLVGEVAVLQRADDAPHAFLGVILYVLHIRLDDIEPEVRHHFAQLLHTFFVGRNLCAQVGDVLIGIARGISGSSQSCAHVGFEHDTIFNQLDVIEQYAFILDCSRKRRHGTGGDATDVGMVSARTDIKKNFLGIVRKHRRYHRHIRQMRPAVVGVVQHVHVAALHLPCVLPHDGLDTLAHRAQMHRHMRRIGDEIACRIKQRATKIQSLLDVHRVSRVG